MKKFKSADGAWKIEVSEGYATLYWKVPKEDRGSGNYDSKWEWSTAYHPDDLLMIIDLLTQAHEVFSPQEPSEGDREAWGFPPGRAIEANPENLSTHRVDGPYWVSNDEELLAFAKDFQDAMAAGERVVVKARNVVFANGVNLEEWKETVADFAESSTEQIEDLIDRVSELEDGTQGAREVQDKMDKYWDENFNRHVDEIAKLQQQIGGLNHRLAAVEARNPPLVGPRPTIPDPPPFGPGQNPWGIKPYAPTFPVTSFTADVAPKKKDMHIEKEEDE